MSYSRATTKRAALAIMAPAVRLSQRMARLEREGLKPSPEADRLTLLRRVTLELTGVPPTPAELEYLFNSPVPITRPDQDVTLQRLHRVTVPRKAWKQLFIFAFDHRWQLVDLAQRGGQDPARISDIKQLFLKVKKSSFLVFPMLYWIWLN